MVPLIDFSDAYWIDIRERPVVKCDPVQDPPDASTPPNCFIDPATAVTFSVASGKMYVTRVGAADWLAFDAITCGSVAVPVAQVSIDIANPSTYYAELAFSHGLLTGSAHVRFFGFTSSLLPVDEQLFRPPDASEGEDQYHIVSYGNRCRALRRIEITSPSAENALQYVTFDRTPPRARDRLWAVDALACALATALRLVERTARELERTLTRFRV